MASSDPPPNDEQALGTEYELNDWPSKYPDTRKDATLKPTPPSSENSAEYSNKRKRASTNTMISNVKETEVVKDIPVADTAETKDENVGTVESTGTREIEMKDAQSVDRSAQQGIKDIEMQDAEVMYNNKQADGTEVPEEGKMHPDVNQEKMGSNLTATEGCKQDQGIKKTEQSRKADVSETKGNEKRSIDAAATNDGSEQKALGEVATLLKQVQQSDAKVKLEVEVKVTKLDDGDVKENAETSEKAQTVSKVSCP